MKRMMRSMLPILAASILCFALPNFSSAREPLPSRQASLDPEVLSSILTGAQTRIRSLMNADMEPYMAALEGQDLSAYSGYAENAAIFQQMAAHWESEAADALDYTMTWLDQRLFSFGVPAYEARWPQNSPTWEYAAALYKAYGSDACRVVKENLRVTLEGVGTKRYVVLSFGTLEEYAGSGSREQMMTAKFTYHYLNTVYDEQGLFQLTEKRTYPETYLEGLKNPLPGKLIKDCWFDPRDRNTRLHTGTDIRAEARAKIRSVTDGVVLYIGYMDVPGNYVVIGDPYGYEYHYYHMYRQTTHVAEGDRVQAGDVIGLVGNTGNSAANHLHVAVIAPDGAYVNPYDLFKQAGFHPIRKDS